jgi:hypothetical protein
MLEAGDKTWFKGDIPQIILPLPTGVPHHTSVPELGLDLSSGVDHQDL